MSGMKCFSCGKGVMYGHNVSHAKNRTNRLFKPNLHVARIALDSGMKRVRLCTKCLRMIKKNLLVKSDLTEAKTAKPQASSVIPALA